jgi:hypothetical protein
MEPYALNGDRILGILTLLGLKSWRARIDSLMLRTPLGPGPHQRAPSRHQLSPGQVLRGAFGRFYISDELAAHLDTTKRGTRGFLKFTLQSQSQSVLALVYELHFLSGLDVVDANIPYCLRGTEEGGTQKIGFCVSTDVDAKNLGNIQELGELEAIVGAYGFNASTRNGDVAGQKPYPETVPFGVLATDSAGGLHFFLIFGDHNAGKIYRMDQVPTRSSRNGVRLPTDLEGLRGKSVGIVGLGSVGSKLALSLARSGVSCFFLIDVDIFLPENICRHVLDWQNVGEHKVDALAERLARVRANIELNVSRLHLTGQESTARLATALSRLGECDLVVDATADPGVFNLLAAVTTTCKKPFIWLEVYAGGIGGMIGRSRPQRDPDPYTMRLAYYEFAAGSERPASRTASDYSLEGEDGKVLTASDADVGVVAYHAARLAVDTLIEREPSWFPYSMYLIGLARSWIFEEPFHTIPISTEHLTRKECAGENVENDVLKENISFLVNLMKKHGEDSSPS